MPLTFKKRLMQDNTATKTIFVENTRKTAINKNWKTDIALKGWVILSKYIARILHIFTDIATNWCRAHGQLE